MKAAPIPFVLLLLSITAIRTALLIRRQAKIYVNKPSATSIPFDGSLKGINTRGNFIDPGQEVQGVYVALFTIHSAKALRDVMFWNDVARVTANPGDGLPRILYWGVCDSAEMCGHVKQEASFEILTHLDPYEMHAISIADSQNEALLYRASGTLVDRLKIAKSAASEGKLILEKSK